MNVLLYKSFVSIYVKSQGADSGPPLGTVLGNLGVNSVKFCKEFNDFTKDLPDFFILPVHVYIYNDRSFSFKVLEPSLNSLLLLLIKEDVDNKILYILSDDLLKLAIFKFPNFPINLAVSLIFSVVKSRKLKVYDSIK
jgi:hypothetical protein